MPNKAVKFKIAYEVDFEGLSRKWPEDEKSFMEDFIDNIISGTLIVLGEQHKGLKIKYKKTKII
jgi:hypothetical protein